MFSKKVCTERKKTLTFLRNSNKCMRDGVQTRVGYGWNKGWLIFGSTRIYIQSNLSSSFFSSSSFHFLSFSSRNTRTSERKRERWSIYPTTLRSRSPRLSRIFLYSPETKVYIFFFHGDGNDESDKKKMNENVFWVAFAKAFWDTNFYFIFSLLLFLRRRNVNEFTSFGSTTQCDAQAFSKWHQQLRENSRGIWGRELKLTVD